ncbi:GumC family protein [Bosea sp. 685]|uniref:GumC family protein n=1 Tax=Bosea sp. 685 TaxID=3080057 RepID=UPI002892C3B8|nr:GumC family protein [Bosea sp. 685]WNJ88577.1 GumC family protein [Bosea sp. 685]
MYFSADDGKMRREGGAPYRRTVELVPAPIRVISAAQILGWLLRGWLWLVIAALLGAIAAVGGAQLLTPRFTATTELTIAPSNLLIAPNDLYATNIQSDAQILDVESKMRMIVSGNVLRRVIDQLGLRNDPEFASKPSLLRFWEVFDSASPSTEASDLAGTLARRMTIVRQERSYVVSLSVWASEAAMSARLANAIAEAFREEVVRADAERVGRAAQGLTARVGEIKAAAAEAEDRVEAFRLAHGLQQGASKQPLGAEALERMSAKLVDAKARLAEAEARNNEVSRALSEHGAQAGAVQSQALSGLFAEEASLRRQIAALSKTLGPRHPSLGNLLAEADAMSKAIRSEIERLRRAARSEVDQARAALTALNGETRTLRGSVSVDDQAQVKLRELEREASAKTALYQTFLTRAGEAAQRQQIDATDVRVITLATAPLRPRWPPRPIIAAAAGMALGLLLAAGLLLGLGYLREFRSGGSAAT